MLQLLARTRFFGEGHRFSGLDPKALGAVYRGRAQFRAPVACQRASSRGQPRGARAPDDRRTQGRRGRADAGSKGKDS